MDFTSRQIVRYTLREMDHPEGIKDSCWSRSAEELILLTLETEGTRIQFSSVKDCYMVYFHSPNELPPYDNPSALASYYAFHYADNEDIPTTINRAKKAYQTVEPAVDYEEVESV